MSKTTTRDESSEKKDAASAPASCPPFEQMVKQMAASGCACGPAMFRGLGKETQETEAPKTV